MSYSKTEIDAVITWVDGNDTTHRKKRLKVLREKDLEKDSVLTGSDNTRFIDNGELQYCIKSIRKFAPWIQNIYLVTDNQVPEFLTPRVKEKYNVSIIDHREIFESYEWALPSFNSRSIESMLHRIPNLSDQFIYFNDDFVLTKPVSQDEFFVDGKVVLRGRWQKATNYNKLRINLNNLVSYIAKNLLGITRSMHLLFQIKSAQTAGFDDVYYRSPHVPHPIKRMTLQKFFDENNSLFEENIQYQFRNKKQFSAIYLANHLEIKKGNAELRKANDAIMVNGEMDMSLVLKRKLKKISDQKVKFVCLQAIDKLNEDKVARIEKTLNKQLK